MIGGKELDLHVLYSEVTRRGGHEKVRFGAWSSIFNRKLLLGFRDGVCVNPLSWRCRLLQRRNGGKLEVCSSSLLQQPVLPLY